jgi:hypothetical protein
MVEYQSAMCPTTLELVPRRLAGISPPDTNAWDGFRKKELKGLNDSKMY